MSIEKIISNINELVSAGRITEDDRFSFENSGGVTVSASMFRHELPFGDLRFCYENKYTGRVNKVADLDDFISSFIFRLWDCIVESKCIDRNLF